MNSPTSDMMMPPPSMMMPPPSMMMPPPSMEKMDDSMMMHMTFFWGRRVDILFSGWPGNQGLGTYIFALFVVFFASFLVEMFAYLPRFLKVNNDHKRLSNGLLLTGFATVRTGLSYLVMLAVMSFNVGVLIVAVFGHAIGFFVFGSPIFKRSTTSSEPAVVATC